MEDEYKQIYVWQGTLLNGKVKEFEQWLKDEFNVRGKVLEEVETKVTSPDGSLRHDLFFAVHNNDTGNPEDLKDPERLHQTFAYRRFEFGIKMWEDVLLNRGHLDYRQETLDKYHPHWCIEEIKAIQNGGRTFTEELREFILKYYNENLEIKDEYKEMLERYIKDYDRVECPLDSIKNVFLRFRKEQKRMKECR